MDNPHLASHTLHRVSQALRENRSAGLPEIVELVQTLSEKAQEISIHDLAVIVEKDTAVLAKILSIANAFGYNPTHMPITNVASANQVIGFERIRTLAISLLLFEQTNRSQSPEERREAAAGALFSGSFAKAAAMRGQYVDDEEAFICASLRHFGRIVLCTFLPEEYREARELAAEVDEDEAFKNTFGLTPIELGYELLRVEHLPPEILSALKQFKPEKTAGSESTAVHRLALADFATQISLIVFNGNIGQKEFSQKTELLAKRFEKLLPGISGSIPSLLSAAESYLSRFNEGLGSRVIPSKVLRSLNHRLAQTDPEKPIPKKRTPAEIEHLKKLAEARAANSVPEAPEPSPEEVKPVPEPSPEQKKLAELESLATDSGTSDLALNAMVTGLLAKAFDAPECILFLATGDKDSDLRIAHGQGGAWQGLRNKAAFRRGDRSTLGLCLQRRENILIHDARDAGIVQHTPPWLKNHSNLGAYVLVPILDRNSNQGLLLAGWPEKRRIVVTPECMETIHSVNRILPKKAKRKVHG